MAKSKKAFKTLMQIFEEYKEEQRDALNIPDNIGSFEDMMRRADDPTFSEPAQKRADELSKRLDDEALHSIVHGAVAAMLKSMVAAAMHKGLPPNEIQSVANFVKSIVDSRDSFSSYELMFLDVVDTWETINERFNEQMPKLLPPDQK